MRAACSCCANKSTTAAAKKPKKARPLPPRGGRIVISWATRIAEVLLPRCTTVRLSTEIGAAEPRSLVRLADVWRASGFEDLLTVREDLAIDFIGTDGHRLGDDEHRGVDGATLARGFIDPETHDLVWEKSLTLPCFFRVKAVAEIIAFPRIALAV